MSDIVESVGEIVQGGATAAAVEPAAGDDGHTHESACLNCGTALIGSHCHACGQSAHVHRTLGAFFHDLLHGVFHFEGKIWRTLPMLAFQPGRLTREYIDGRRASYISPIALFLFFVFLMFAVFHATSPEDSAEGSDPAAVAEVRKSLGEAEGKLAKLKQDRAAALSAGKDTAAIDAKIGDEEAAIKALKSFGEGGFLSVADKDVAPDKSYGDIPALDKAVKTFRSNPDLAAYKLQTYAYKYSWALIPISVPFLWLLFPFSRRFHLYDHTVFVTYSLCFMTMLVILTMLLGAVGAAWVGALAFFVPPFHMYRQLRGTYGTSRFGGLVRTSLLVGFASTALLIFFMILMAQTGL